MVQMHACARGSESLGSCAKQSVNLCTPPLNPCSCAKPPTGGRREPVTNCSSCSRSRSEKERTALQNQRKLFDDRRIPPEVSELRCQSAASMSASPASMQARSAGVMSWASSPTIRCGTAAYIPRSIASTCRCTEPKSRHSHAARTYSSLFSSSTASSSPPGRSSTRRSISASAGASAESAAERSCSTSVKSRQRCSTGLERTYSTLCLKKRASSSATSVSVHSPASLAHSSSLQMDGCSRTDTVTCCSSASPRKRPNIS
mmetsp:Transcript_19426/g.41842  ORF Transcript_19426/g.41842 Transcript_19426/m.41842 type:complete len:260 (-) Transcript_19426:501-1280(-)